MNTRYETNGNGKMSWDIIDRRAFKEGEAITKVRSCQLKYQKIKR
jgi:hypothetical protein